jgi:hypothetical protein
MDAVSYARKSLEQSFWLFNVIADGMTDEQYNWKPEGTANSIAKSHVHAMSSVDFFINGTLKCSPLEWPPFASAHGLPANPADIWACTTPVSLSAMKEYTASVQKAVLEYVDSLKGEDFDREVETPFFGKKNVAFMVGLAAVHTMGHGGDMSAVKGLQGLKGLPF